MGDTVLQKILEDGVNFHDFNTEIFFGIKAPNADNNTDAKRWSKLRKAAKIIVFARIMYGGSDRGIYRKVMTAVPDCGLTYEDFCSAIKRYMDAHPEYVQWCHDVQKIAKEKRISVNAFGRVRTLFGSDDIIMRQALNSPVQGSAADVARSCMPEFLEYIERKGWTGKVKLALQIHDEYVLEYPKELRQEVAQMAADIMSKAITINGKTFNLKIDIEVGKYWGGMQGYDPITNSIKSETKH